LLVISSFSAMVRTSWVLVIPFAIVLLLFVNRVAVWWPVLGRPRSGQAPFRESENREIASVDAGAEKRTAIHNQPFRDACQWVFLGFHRFFAGFSGFYRSCG
jgi:hypothetical protein